MSMRRLPIVEVTVPAVLVAFLWWASLASTSFYFPSMPRILGEFQRVWFSDQFPRHVLPSLTSLGLGFGLALLGGILLGIPLARVPRLENALSPILEFFRATPVAAIVPVALLALGPGAGMEISLIAFGSIWPILLATIDGVKGVDPVYLQTGAIYGLNRGQLLRRIIFPAALPQIAAGVKIGIASAVAAMVIANMVGAVRGIGYFVLTAQQSFDILGTWAGLILIGLTGSIASGLYALLRHFMLGWHRDWKKATDQQ
jgi:sulfonate transport system permease protein